MNKLEEPGPHVRGTTCSPCIHTAGSPATDTGGPGPLMGNHLHPRHLSRKGAGRRAQRGRPSDRRRATRPSTGTHQGVATGRDAPSRIPSKHRTHRTAAHPRCESRNYQGGKSQLPSSFGSGFVSRLLLPPARRSLQGEKERGPRSWDPLALHTYPHSRVPIGHGQGSQVPTGGTTCALFH